MNKETSYFLICVAVVAALFLFVPQPEAQQKVIKPLEKAMPKAPYQLPDISMVWQHEPADYPHLDKFKIFAGQTKETATEVKEVKYEGQQPFSTTINLSVSANPGDIIRYYFALQSFSKTGNPTNKVFGKTASGAEFLEFVIPKDVADPFNVIIKIVVK